MPPGQLWVIEGTDGSGKRTQSELTVQKLNESGVLGNNKAHLVSFPNYEGPWGKLVREYLSAENPLQHLVTPLFASLLYVADRVEQAPRIREILERGDWIICDRYVPSNIAHQCANVVEADRPHLQAWLERIEYEHFALPRESGVIYLQLERRISERRTQDRRTGERRATEQTGQVAAQDRHEDNPEHITTAAAMYAQLAQEKEWHLIPCNEGECEFTREQIAERVWNTLKQYFPN